MGVQRAVGRLNNSLNSSNIAQVRGAFHKLKTLAIQSPRDRKHVVGPIMRECSQNVAEYLIQHFPAVLLEFATGVGKTKPAIRASVDKQTVLVVHKQLVHKKNLTEEFLKWLPDYNMDKVTFSTYASLHKLVGTKWDYVIMDEVHGITERNLEYLKEVRMEKLVMLSATVPYEKRRLISSLTMHLFQKRYVRFEIPLIQAIRTGILPTPELVVIDRYLDSTERDLVYYRQKNKDFKPIQVPFQERTKYPYNNLNIICSEYEYYQCLCEDMEYWKKRYFMQGEEWQKFKWLQFGSRRKNWLSDLKTDLAIQLKGKLTGQRFVCFTNSIAQCEKISGDKVAVHSKSEDNQQIIDSYNNGLRDELYCVNMLNESMNLTSLDYAILVTLSGAEIQNVQRFGRSTRAKRPVIYILRVPYTRDEDNFKKFLGELSEDFVTYKSIEEI